MTQADAEILALKGLAWLVNSDSARDRFLAETGVDRLNLRRSAGEPEFLGAVMDFLMGDEALAAAFCADKALAPETLMRARQALPGAA